jgi:hypothetical protein
VDGRAVPCVSAVVNGNLILQVLGSIQWERQSVLTVGAVLGE